ncbi:MAG: tRNA modification GTPase, partial [Candidatus Anammoxibacter sp.]
MLSCLDDTIVALSTPSGPSLRAILRISGPDALHCVDHIFTKELPSNCQSDDNLKSRDGEIEQTPTFRSINGYIHVKKEQTHIPVTLYVMKSPHSFTKEDIVEIHTIGAAPIIEMILSEILFNQKHLLSNNPNRTIRLAEPGEFTKRAFLNGRIDLTQAEAVMKLVRSRSDSEVLAGMSLLKGKGRLLINDLRDQMVDLCGKIEASIDFSDQDILLISHEEIKNQLHLIHQELLNLTSDNKAERHVHAEGINVALCGKPNVGKSCLLNAFSPEIKAIVSDSAHTTRDSVKRTIKIDNLCFNFFDNPGIDAAIENVENTNCSGEVEDINSQSMSKSEESLNQADIVIFVLDGSCALKDADKYLLDKIKDKKSVVIINKCDLPQKINLPEADSDTNKFPVIKTSAINGTGIDDLKNELKNIVLKGDIDQSGSHLIMNARQKTALSNTANFIDYAIKTTK